MRISIGKLLTSSVAAGALLVSFVLPATANAQRNRVNRVQHAQLRQIHRGLQNGNLTKQQATSLAKQERDINALKTKMNNGTPSAADKAALKKHLNEQEKDIQGAEKMNEATEKGPTPVTAAPSPTSTQPPL